MRCVIVAAVAGAAMGAPRDNSVCATDKCDDTCILTNRKLDFPPTTNATHGMHSEVSGTLSKDVTPGATFELSASFMGVAVPVTPATGSVCGGPVVFDVSGLSTVTIDFSNGGKQVCPQPAGSTSVTPTDVVSSADPPMGKFLVNVVVKNGDGTLIQSLVTQVGGCPAAPPPAPPATKYECNNGQCVASASGADLPTCQLAC